MDFTLIEKAALKGYLCRVREKMDVGRVTSKPEAKTTVCILAISKLGQRQSEVIIRPHD